MSYKIGIDQAPSTRGTDYPSPFDEPCRERFLRRLGDAAGLTQFGVNLLVLPPGAWSSQRYWHTVEDEFVYVLDGEVVLVTDAGEELLKAGDCAGFPSGVRDGHHLQNRSTRAATILDIGTRRLADDEAFYPDIDLHALKNDEGYAHRDGRPYPSK